MLDEHCSCCEDRKISTGEGKGLGVDNQNNYMQQGFKFYPINNYKVNVISPLYLAVTLLAAESNWVLISY